VIKQNRPRPSQCQGLLEPIQPIIAYNFAEP
jgi:hypothetical protein